MFYKKHKNIILPIAVFPILILIWDLAIRILDVPSYLMPRPGVLFESFIKLFQTANIWDHIKITLQEIFIGTGIGIVIGVTLGYIMAKIRIIEKLIMPFVIIVQTAPKISLAPLFILWMGLGMNSKIALVVLVVSFPIMINQVLAIRSIDNNVYDLMNILGASKIQRFIYVELPYSIEMMLSGIKVAVTQAMIGAVIGEMIGSKAGLGYLLILGSETYDINLILNSVLILSLIGLILYLVSEFMEKKILFWKEIEKSAIG